MEGLSFLSGGELFAVDVTLVQMVIRNMAFTPIPAAPFAVAGIANMKGGIVTLLSLSELLGRGRDALAVNAVVFKSLTNGNDQMGLLIDKPENLITIHEDEILSPDFMGKMGEMDFILGLAEIGERLYRVIDVDSIINRYRKSGGTISQEGEKENEEI